jgi:hypothetical protein
MTNNNAAEVVAKIGNVAEVEIVDGVIYTLAHDAVVRVNDADTGLIVHRVTCRSFDAAAALFKKTVADAKATADNEIDEHARYMADLARYDADERNDR